MVGIREKATGNMWISQEHRTLAHVIGSHRAEELSTTKTDQLKCCWSQRKRRICKGTDGWEIVAGLH